MRLQCRAGLSWQGLAQTRWGMGLLKALGHFVSLFGRGWKQMEDMDHVEQSSEHSTQLCELQRS